MFWRSLRKKTNASDKADAVNKDIVEETVFISAGLTEQTDNPSAQPGEPPSYDSRSEDEAGEQPPDTPVLKVPTNFEVREMVMRQLKESRKIARYMQSTDDLVEEKIKKAMENGYFDKIEGKGKPLIFEENPFEDPSLRLPFKMLKDAGFAPYWIELGKEIDAEIEGAHMLFDKFIDGIKWRKARKGYLEWNPELEDRRDHVLESCAKKFDTANKKTDLYNRIVPIYWMQRFKVDERDELSQMRKKWEETVVRPSLNK